MAAARASGKLPNILRELRIHHCQKSQSSAGVRKFVENQYIALKQQNPNLPILIRECSGIYPKLYARYDFGQEKSVDISNMTENDVAMQIKTLASSST